MTAYVAGATTSPKRGECRPTARSTVHRDNDPSLATIDTTILDIARLAYITVLMAGLLLYYSHLERRLGKDLIKGGVVFAVLSELVFPYLTKL